MQKLNRGDKIYLDTQQTKESSINSFLDCRDATIHAYEFNQDSGYGSKVRFILCDNYKHEVMMLVKQTYSNTTKEWSEIQIDFDSDSFRFLKSLINYEPTALGEEYFIIRES
jgi:hypothetical protein